MVGVEEALKRILDSFSPLGLETTNILDGLGRVIGEDIYAGRAMPPKDHSTMDGYALRSIDTLGTSQEKPSLFDVVDDIPAGAIPKRRIEAGQAARIMTGAPLPDGADAVVRMEDTRKEKNRVALFAEARKGRNVRYAGEDVKIGEKVISRGEIIRPAEVGMLASLGRAFVLVRRRPLVAIVATGNELMEIDAPPTPWKIVGSNSYSLAALVKECGGVPLQIGIAKDSREDLLAKFGTAMRADLILSSGGVSVGDYDLVKSIMNEPGNRIHFWQVAMKPGRPLAFGSLGDVPIVGLPGNPVSSMVSFEQFVRPAILKMTGHTNLFRRTVQARLGEEIRKKEGVRYFIRARIELEPEGYSVVTKGSQGSDMIRSMVRANGLIVLPEKDTTARKGSAVTVQLLDDSLERMPSPGY